ncbi:MAG: DUF4147 domain-containing protein [Acidobacteriota bacterium]|nr:DUF4147 domain-containing protein [Acidobacteriota bacterium]
MLTVLPASLSRLRAHALEITNAAIEAVTPSRLVTTAVADPVVREFLGPGPVTVVAAGKAAAGMVEGFVAATDVPIRHGVAVGVEDARIPPPLRWRTGGHPGPTSASVLAGREALRAARETPGSECLVVLLSGGASALLAVPADRVTLDEKIEATRALLAAGVPIHEINCVRKHLSAVKGGCLARASPGRVLTLAVSDVVSPVEDDPSVIGSGPTVPDTTTYADALAIIDRPGLRERVPPGVRVRFERGKQGRVSETLKEEADPTKSLYRVIGSRRHAMQGAEAAAQARGYATTLIDTPIVGEARWVGARHPARMLRAAESMTGSRCVVSSGETTVTVRGKGRGGRNQEVALGAVAGLPALGDPMVFVSVGTDGIDGPTDAAGAIVDSASAARALRLRLPPPDTYLIDNNAYAYFDRLGDLIRVGPTGTNVGDLQLLLTR